MAGIGELPLAWTEKKGLSACEEHIFQNEFFCIAWKTVFSYKCTYAGSRCSFVHGFRLALKPSTSRMTSTERLSLIESPGGNHSPTIPQLLIPWKLLQFPRTPYKGSASKIPQKLGVKKGSKWGGFIDGYACVCRLCCCFSLAATEDLCSTGELWHFTTNNKTNIITIITIIITNYHYHQLGKGSEKSFFRTLNWKGWPHPPTAHI